MALTVNKCAVNTFCVIILWSAACLQTITLLGPMFGFLLGSYCAKLYVDIGDVSMGERNSFVLVKVCVISYGLSSLVSST